MRLWQISPWPAIIVQESVAHIDFNYIDCWPALLPDIDQYLQIQGRTKQQFVWLEYNQPWYSESISRPASCLSLPAAPGNTQLTSVLRDFHQNQNNHLSGFVSHNMRKCYTCKQSVLFFCDTELWTHSNPNQNVLKLWLFCSEALQFSVRQGWLLSWVLAR